MIGESSRPRLAGIRPAPLCREDDRRSQKKLIMAASSLPSLARLGMFKSANDAKSKFIHKHMRAATALAQASPEGGATPCPRLWGGPPEFPRVKVSEPLAVMATEAALENFRRSQVVHRKLGHRRRGRMNNDDPARQHRSGASTSTTISTAARKARFLQQSQSDGQLRHNRTKHRHNHHGSSYGQPRHNHHQYQQQQQQQNRPPSTHAVVLPQGGGLILVGEDGVRKSKFPRGCERPPGSGGAAGKRAEAVTVSITEQSTAGSGGKEDVLTRLCNPKHFTGTAATGHLPTVVDLEGGVGVLLKGDSTAVKDHIGAEEASWRLRLAERL